MKSKQYNNFLCKENIAPNSAVCLFVFFMLLKDGEKNLKYSAPEIFKQIAFKTSYLEYMDRDVDVGFSHKIFFGFKIMWVHLF